MRWTRMMAHDGRLNARTAKSCGPDAPMLASSRPRCERIVPVKVARQPGHLGEHEVSRKTTAQGKPALLRFTCGPTPVLSILHGAHGCDRHPAFPAPSAL